MEPAPEPSPQPPPPSNPFQMPAGVPAIASTTDERNLALLAHLGGILTGFIVPLIVWLIKKDQSKYVDDQGKEALNFQLNLLGHVLILILASIVTCGFGLLLFFPWGVYAIVMPIIAGVKASSGEAYRYPLTLRVLQ